MSRSTQSHVGIYITSELNIKLVFTLVSLANNTFCSNCFGQCRYLCNNAACHSFIVGATRDQNVCL